MNFDRNYDSFEDPFEDSSTSFADPNPMGFEDADDNGFWAPAPYEPADDDGFSCDDSFSRQSANRSSFNLSALPWKHIAIAVGILLAIICCVVFRYQITSFLKMVLSWVITIIVIAILVYFLFRALFGGRRRW